MPLALSNLTLGSTLAASSNTASVSVPNNSVVYVACAAAQTAPNQPNTDFTVSGLSLTWTNVSSLVGYGSRRGAQLFRAINTSGSTQNGAISITANPSGGGTIQEIAWIVDLAETVDTTTPNDAAQTGTVASGDVTLPDLGTPDSGDIVYVVTFSSSGAASAGIPSGFTSLGDVTTGGTHIRDLVSSYDGSDPQNETPTATVANGGAIGIIINAGSAGSPPTPPHARGYGPDRYGPMTALRM